MNVEDLIDKALEQGDLVPPGSQDYVTRRRLALAFLQEVFEDAYWRRDWPFKRQGPTTITVLAGESRAAAPLDFQSIGTYGGLYDSDGDPLLEVPESVIFDARQQNSYQNDRPGIFSIFGQDPLTYKVYFQFPPNTDQLSFELWYQPKPPRLLDSGDPDLISTFYAPAGGVTRVAGIVTFNTTSDHDFQTGDLVLIAGATQTDYNGSHRVTVTAADQFTYEIDTTPATPATTGSQISVELDMATGNAALNVIDPQYHHSVLLNGVKAKLRESKGDARWQYLKAEYETHLQAMLREEQRLQSDRMRQIPSFFGTMGRSRY